MSMTKILLRSSTLTRNANKHENAKHAKQSQLTLLNVAYAAFKYM
jgi:hypothetical protein